MEMQIDELGRMVDETVDNIIEERSGDSHRAFVEVQARRMSRG